MVSVHKMVLPIFFVIIVIAASYKSNAFTASVRPKPFIVSCPLLASPLPTMEQLATDPFMKQVEHGFTLTANLWSDQPNVQDYLQAQLSHSDGIRGFMVSYLTADESPADQPEIPNALWGALQMQMESDIANDLISLTCKQRNKVGTKKLSSQDSCENLIVFVSFYLAD